MSQAPRNTSPTPVTTGQTNISTAAQSVAPVTAENVTSGVHVVQRLSFSSETIKRLTAGDFNLESGEMITLKDDQCVLILFYVENTESHQLADIWGLVAQQTAGPVFAAINVLSERKVAEAFTKLKSDGNNPLHWAALRQFPYILVYRNKWPVAVYNGPRSVQALIDYSLTLACQAGYYETQQIGGSMQAENRIEMGPYDPYVDIPGSPPRIRKTSVEFNSENPIRGFNPNIPIVVTGSAQAQQATEQIRSAEIRQQQGESEGVATSLTETAETTPTIDRIIGEPAVAPRPGTNLPSTTATNIAVPVPPSQTGTPATISPAQRLPEEPTIATPA